MNSALNAPHRAWSTSSQGDSTDTTPMQLAALGEHVSQCSRLDGRVGALMFGADLLLSFVTGRLVTTLAVLALVLVPAYVLWL